MIASGAKEADWYLHNAEDCYSAMLAAAPDLRPNATEAQPAPAEKPTDQQIEHLVTREDVEPLITEGKARYLWSKAHDDTTDRMAFQVFAQLVAAHVAQKLKGVA